MKARHTFLATGLVALLGLAGVTAAIAADPAGDPPPKIAFLANGIVPADALAAGPIAGQLNAPVFTTQPDNLSAPAAAGLDDHEPELVIVLGGPVAIQDGVLAQVSSVTGLPVVADPDSRPDSGIVRAAGEDRFETAQVVAQLLGDYDPAYLGVDLMAKDSDLLDGKDSDDFLTSVFDAENALFDSLAGATSSGTAKTIMTLDVPAGTYAVHGQIGVNTASTDASRVVCNTTLGSASTRGITRIGNTAGNAGQAMIPVAFTSTVAGDSTITVECWAEALTGDAPFVGASTTRIVAVRMNG